MRHILVPTDFSKTAAKAIDHALSLAALSNAKVTILHVIFAEKIDEAVLGLDALKLLSSSTNVPPDSSQYVPAYDLSNVRSAAQQNLDQIVSEIGQSSVTIATAVELGRPSQAIADFAGKNNVDLIVIGTHGRGSVGRLLLGSVTENVIRESDCPVMAVRK